MEFSEYTALKRAIEEDYRKKLEALDLVFSLSKELGPQPQLPGTDKPATSDVNGSRAEPTATERNGVSRREADTDGTTEPFVLKEAVKAVARSVPEDKVFSQRFVTVTLRTKHRDRRIHAGSVSSTLKRLVEEGKVEIAKPALGGSNPALYRWVRKEDSVPP